MCSEYTVSIFMLLVFAVDGDSMSFPCVLNSMSTMPELGWGKTSTKPAAPIGRLGEGCGGNLTQDASFSVS